MTSSEMSVERYEIAIAAERAGTGTEELRRLVELGILQPDADGRFSDGDIRRVGIVRSLVAESIPLDLLASALRSGDPVELKVVEGAMRLHAASLAGRVGASSASRAPEAGEWIA